MLLKTALVSALLLAVASAQKEINSVQKCEDEGLGKLTSLTITPCTAEPCKMKKGSEVTFGFKYVSDMDSNGVELQGTVDGPFGIKIPIPGLVRDFCKVVDCPVQKGVEYSGSFSMKIARVPISKTVVEMRVVGDAGLSTCFRFPVLLY